MWIQSLLFGMLGGIIYILIQKLGWQDNYEIVRRLAFGLISGLIIHLMGHMDALTTITAGYFGLDLIEAFINSRMKKTG